LNKHVILVIYGSLSGMISNPIIAYYWLVPGTDSRVI